MLNSGYGGGVPLPERSTVPSSRVGGKRAMRRRRDKTIVVSDGDQVAGNGLLDRRLFLTGGTALASAAGLAGMGAGRAEAETLTVAPWMKTIGTPFSAYGQPSKFESKVVRTWAAPANAPGTGSARTPLHMLTGM